jgi:hypothetical protein
MFLAVLGLGLVAVAQLPTAPPPPTPPPASAGPLLAPPTSDTSGLSDAAYAAAIADSDLAVASAYDPAADADPSALVEFREVLAPHGHWLDDPTYGTVWVPNAAAVGPDFVPYQTAGHWAIADDGQWLWVSDYDWGYVPFHYGRWVWLQSASWAWIPGRVYSPAWVLWRTGLYGYDYVGWAPMPPSFVWMNGLAVGIAWGLAIPWWFCPSAYLFDPGWRRHIVHDRAVAQRIVANSRVSGASAPAAPASPSGTASRPRPEPAGVDLRRFPRSPSLAEARISTSASPATRVPHDVRALALRGALPPRRLATDAPLVTREPYRPAPRPAPRVLRGEPSTSPMRAAPRVLRAEPSTSPMRAAPSVLRAETSTSSMRVSGFKRPASPARSYSPPMRSYSPPMRSYSPPMRSYSPPMRSFGGGRR